MREFESGANRDDIEGKLSYMRALSPEVLRTYVQYLARHRDTPNGRREFDNWKKGIDQDTYCDSMLRHAFDAWLLKLGYTPSDESYDLKDLLCAIIFNAQGWLFELIRAEDREQLDALKECDVVEAEYDENVKVSVTCGNCANYRPGNCWGGDADALADPRCFKPKGGPTATCGGCVHYNGQYTCHKGRPNAGKYVLIGGCPDFQAKKVPA